MREKQGNDLAWPCAKRPSPPSSLGEFLSLIESLSHITYPFVIDGARPADGHCLALFMKGINQRSEYYTQLYQSVT